MSVREQRRAAAIEAIAEQLLREGLAAANIRTMAVAAGASERMLLYYFVDKEDAINATLARLAQRLAGLLDAVAGPETRLPFAALLGLVWEAVKSPALRPFMHLWLDLAAAGARQQEPHRATAGQLAEAFLLWLRTRLESPEGEREQDAALLLAGIEGLVLLDAVGRREAAELAAELIAKRAA